MTDIISDARLAEIRAGLEEHITDYLSNGGLFNPELMDHAAVRDLLIDCRAALLPPPPES